MAWFGRKKEEKKKFDYSDETKELFAERDAFYAEQRRKMGGEPSNPELANQPNSEAPKSRTEDLDDLLGDSDGFDPYVDKDQDAPDTSQSVPAPSPQPSSSSEFACTSCGKTFQEKWGKCPSCGGEMKMAESASSPEPEEFTPLPPAEDTSGGDPLDGLIGDFSEPSPEEAPSDDSDDDRRGDDVLDRISEPADKSARRPQGVAGKGIESSGMGKSG
jgi:rubrerythrin